MKIYLHKKLQIIYMELLYKFSQTFFITIFSSQSIWFNTARVYR